MINEKLNAFMLFINTFSILVKVVKITLIVSLVIAKRGLNEISKIKFKISRVRSINVHLTYVVRSINFSRFLHKLAKDINHAHNVVTSDIEVDQFPQ